MVATAFHVNPYQPNTGSPCPPPRFAINWIGRTEFIDLCIFQRFKTSAETTKKIIKKLQERQIQLNHQKKNTTQLTLNKENKNRINENPKEPNEKRAKRDTTPRNTTNQSQHQNETKQAKKKNKAMVVMHCLHLPSIGFLGREF